MLESHKSKRPNKQLRQILSSYPKMMKMILIMISKMKKKSKALTKPPEGINASSKDHQIAKLKGKC
jgi:hypothetical protein